MFSCISSSIAGLVRYFNGAPASAPETGLGRADDSFQAHCEAHLPSGFFRGCGQLAFAVNHLPSARAH